jgi:hypothetical protein
MSGEKSFAYAGHDGNTRYHILMNATFEMIDSSAEMSSAVRAARSALSWVWNRCRSDVCTRTEDRRRVKPDLKSGRGGLLIAAPE